MASQVSPGVVIRERDLSTGVLTGVSGLRAGFASSFRSGPVGKITNIGSERELINTFGAPAEANAADWLVAGEFLRSVVNSLLFVQQLEFLTHQILVVEF